MVQGHKPVYDMEKDSVTSVRKHIEPLLLKYKVDIGVKKKKTKKILFNFSFDQSILDTIIVIIVLILYLMENLHKHQEMFIEIQKLLFN